ncbi:MAG TPA: hypothetical protein VEA69_07315 [Tepidisphaeraceae bacterium]|nr:hypothetical protein [Tepidisphaeraceae bacterium]
MNEPNERKGSGLVVVTAILAIVVLALAGWDAMLQARVKTLEKRVAELEGGKGRAKGGVEAAPADAVPATAPTRGRRGGRGTAPATTQSATAPTVVAPPPK